MSKREFTPEEIAKSLRVCCTPKPDRGFIPRIDCESCGFKRSPGTCRWDLQRAGAYMIEAQAKRIGELEAELAKLREENRWIPAEERLPDEEYAAALAQGDEDVMVIAMIRGGDVATALRYDGDIGVFFTVDDVELIAYTVSHWKPMPKRPEG